MSGENITILEGGKAENFGQVTKLKTSNGSGNDLWVPKTDVETKHLSVKKNGLYYTNQYEPTASEKKDGKFYDIYGWDTITVSVKKKTKGKKKKKKPDGSEVDVPTMVEVDDGGNLIETELPTSIKITTLPKKLNYVDGQDISIAGIVVTAYLEDGTKWGNVPFDELGFEPLVATNSGSGATSDVIGGAVLYYGTPPVIDQWGSNKYIVDGGQIGFVVNGGKIVASDSPFICSLYELWGDSPDHHNQQDRQAGSVTYHDKTAYWGGWSQVGVVTNVPINNIQGVGPAEAAWTAIYGDKEGGSNEVTVTWYNEDLDEPLSDTYEITVGQGPTPPNA